MPNPLDKQFQLGERDTIPPILIYRASIWYIHAYSTCKIDFFPLGPQCVVCVFACITQGVEAEKIMLASGEFAENVWKLMNISYNWHIHS